MITPAPTSSIDPTLARGVLAEVHGPTATKPAFIILTIPNTSYRVHLVPTAPIATPIGRRIVGIIRAEALRIDVVRTGGLFIEPVFGRPRRVQGRVTATDDARRVLIVNAGIPIHSRMLDERQKPSVFPVGELVSYDVLDGATFTPVPG